VSSQILKLHDEEWVMRQYDALAHSLARRYYANVSASHELEELVQVARMGILEAARNFDESRGTKFITHAYNSAWHSLSRYLRKNPGLVRVTNVARDGVLVCGLPLAQADHFVFDGGQPFQVLFCQCFHSVGLFGLNHALVATARSL